MYTPLHKKNLNTLLNQIKASAKKRNIECSLTIVDLNNLMFPIRCPVLGLELKFHRGKALDNSYSIDRIDSSRGYHIDNIVVISHRANKLKSNATLEEMEKLVAFYKSLTSP